MSIQINKWPSRWSTCALLRVTSTKTSLPTKSKSLNSSKTFPTSSSSMKCLIPRTTHALLRSYVRAETCRNCWSKRRPYQRPRRLIFWNRLLTGIEGFISLGLYTGILSRLIYSLWMVRSRLRTLDLLSKRKISRRNAVTMWDLQFICP